MILNFEIIVSYYIMRTFFVRIGALALTVATLCTSLSVNASTLPSNFTETTIGGGWNEAVGITFASDGRMFVWERAGRIWIVENGVKSAQPFLDISDEVGGWRVDDPCVGERNRAAVGAGGAHGRNRQSIAICIRGFGEELLD